MISPAFLARFFQVAVSCGASCLIGVAFLAIVTIGLRTGMWALEELLGWHFDELRSRGTRLRELLADIIRPNKK